MTLANWIAVAGIAVAVVVPLVVAYLHRRQMRQIEAFRIEPSAGLLPPPHPVSLFLKRYGTLLWVEVWSIAMLVFGLLKSPPTRLGVLEIGLGCAGLIGAPALHLIGRLVGLAEMSMIVFEENGRSTDSILTRLLIMVQLSKDISPTMRKTIDEMLAALREKRDGKKQRSDVDSTSLVLKP